MTSQMHGQERMLHWRHRVRHRCNDVQASLQHDESEQSQRLELLSSGPVGSEKHRFLAILSVCACPWEAGPKRTSVFLLQPQDKEAQAREGPPTLGVGHLILGQVDRNWTFTFSTPAGHMPSVAARNRACRCFPGLLWMMTTKDHPRRKYINISWDCPGIFLGYCFCVCTHKHMFATHSQSQDNPQTSCVYVRFSFPNRIGEAFAGTVIIARLQSATCQAWCATPWASENASLSNSNDSLCDDMILAKGVGFKSV